MSNIIKQSYLPENKASGVIISIKQIDRKETELPLMEELTPEQLLQRARHEAWMVKQKAAEEADELKRKMVDEYEHHQNRLKQVEEELQIKMQAEIEAAKTAGYEAGVQEGTAFAQNQWSEKLSKAEKIISSSRDAYNSHIESSERVIVEMAALIARKITGAVLQDETVWLEFVKQLIKEVRETGEIKLYVHPDWYEKTVIYREELRNILLGTAALYIYPDSSLNEYGCIIESQYGKVDATLDSQLSEIKTALLNLLEGSDNESR